MIWNMLLALPAQASRWALAGALLMMIGLLAACTAVPGGQPATGATGATKITGQRPARGGAVGRPHANRLRQAADQQAGQSHFRPDQHR